MIFFQIKYILCDFRQQITLAANPITVNKRGDISDPRNTILDDGKFI